MNLKAKDVKRAVTGNLIRIKFDISDEKKVGAILGMALVEMNDFNVKIMDNRMAGKRVARIHYKDGDGEEIKKRLENRGVSFER